MAFLAALVSGMPPYHALFFASLGNVLAIVFNYYLGYFFYEKMHNNLQKSSFGRKALTLSKGYSYLLLPLSWLPLIGDPLTIVAGLLRVKFVWFLVVAGGLRVMRYYFLIFTTLS